MTMKLYLFSGVRYGSLHCGDITITSHKQLKAETDLALFVSGKFNSQGLITWERCRYVGRTR
jgi:hypothetical protein